MTAKQKLAQKRLTLLQLAEKPGNVSKAYRLHKVSGSQFYEYKRAFRQYGIDGLVDKPPIPLSHHSPERVNCQVFVDNSNIRQLMYFELNLPLAGNDHATFVG